MTGKELFEEFIMHDHRKGLTCTIDIRPSSKPGFELIGVGQFNLGKGYRFYLSEDLVVIRDNQSRLYNEHRKIVSPHLDDPIEALDSIIYSSLYGDYHGCTNRYFGGVLVHYALELKSKITVTISTDENLLFKDLPPDVQEEMKYDVYLKDRKRVVAYDSLQYSDNKEFILQHYKPCAPHPNRVVFTDGTAEQLQDQSPVHIPGYTEYVTSYTGKRHFK
ncbi:TPA: hypothetical protein ACWZ17_000586 [Escherichia coli]